MIFELFFQQEPSKNVNNAQHFVNPFLFLMSVKVCKQKFAENIILSHLSVISYLENFRISLTFTKKIYLTL